MSSEEPQVQYGETTLDRLKAFALNDAARERLNGLAARYWEISAYVGLVIFAAVLRFYDLGARAMHHDESLHGYFSYGFTKALREFFTFGTANVDSYKHEPFMHGPFQFIGPGFVMWIFQDGEFQARLLAAAMGTAMVFMPFLLRRQIGVAGALAAATFIAISPTLTYYSRFIREDIYTAFWTFGIVIFMWRYLSDRDNKFLYLTALFMAGAFATKETTFMSVGAFLLFLDFLLALHIADRIRVRRPMDTRRYVGLTLLLVPVAWLIAVGWPFLEQWRKQYEMEELPAAGNLLVVMGTLAVPMYAAAVQLLPGFGAAWHNRADNNGATDLNIVDAEKSVAFATIFLLVGLSTTAGLLWRPRVWAIAAAAFWVPFILLYTTFFSNPAGLFSGLWGSMDYWISQQDVRRGDQPDYYYFITLPVYEFVPLALSVAAGLYYAIRGKLVNALIVGGGIVVILLLLALPPGPSVDKVSSVHVILPFLIVLGALFAFPMDNLNRFLLFWFVVTLFALTVAGEKMPWLNVHLALPLAVIAGRFVGQLIERSDLRDDLPKLEILAPFAYAAIASALAVLVFVVVGPFTLASAGGWLLVIVAAISAYWAFAGYSRRTAMQVAMVGAVAAFSIFSLRATVLASWGHPDNPYKGTLATRDYGEVPIEMLVYTQTSGDIPVLQDKIDQYARETGLGKEVPVVVDSTDGYTWPWAWYLRNYTNVTFTDIPENYTPPEGAVILASTGKAQNVQVGDGYEQTPYHHRRWFPEQYRNGRDGPYTTGDFFRDIVSADMWGKWIDYWVRRTPPSEIGSVDGVAFFPKGVIDIPTQPVGPTVRTEGTQLVIGGSGQAPGQLNQPSDVAVDAQGNIYVADTSNNRIQKYDAQGNYVAMARGFAPPGPWSLTVADDGTVFVAATWDHQIWKFNSSLEKVGEWGAGGEVEPGGDPMKLFGPRDIAMTPDGNVLVSDTGNGRVIEYTPDGEFVRQFGQKGKSGAPLEFDEPVGLAVADNGDIYVADFWNQRIVHLDKDLQLKQEIAVPTWGSNNVTDRPYLALLPDGRLLATDPNPCDTAPECPSQDGQLLIFDVQGNQVGTYAASREGESQLVRPVGLAVSGDSVLVSDSAGHVVRKIPLAEVAP